MPVGVPPPDAAAIVAVNVTVSPTVDGLALETSAVVVPIWSTVWVRVSLEAV